jgi:hypothetical protein
VNKCVRYNVFFMRDRRINQCVLPNVVTSERRECVYVWQRVFRARMTSETAATEAMIVYVVGYGECVRMCVALFCVCVTESTMLQKRCE